MMGTRDHGTVHPLLPLTVGGGVLEDDRKVVQASLGGLLRWTRGIGGRNESADTWSSFVHKEMARWRGGEGLQAEGQRR